MKTNMKLYNILFQVICLFFLLIYGLFFYTGCSKKETEDFIEKTKEETEEQEIENPFQELEQDSNTEIVASYGYTITNYDKDKRIVDDYQGGELQFDFTFDNDGLETEVGMIIYIDGIAQYLKEKGSDRAAYLMPITLQKKTNTKLSIYFTPVFGINAKEHELNFACIYVPSYQYHGQKMEQVIGNYHHALPMLTWKLNYDYQGELPVISTAFKTEKITPKKLAAYFDVPKEELHSLSLFLTQDGKKVSQYLDLSDETNDTTKLVLMGGTVCTYRLAALINHTPVAVFDGNLYADVKVKENKLSIVELDFASIKKQLNEYDTFYIIATPLSLDSKFIQEKTNSVSVLLNSEQEKNTIEKEQESSENILSDNTKNKEDKFEHKQNQNIIETIADIVKKKRLLLAQSVGANVFMLAMQNKQQTLEFAFINKKTTKLLSTWQDNRLHSVPEVVVVQDIPILYDNAGNVFLLDENYQIIKELKLFELLQTEELHISNDGEKRNYCVLPKKKKILWVEETVFHKDVVYDIYTIGFNGKGKKRLERIYGPKKELHRLNGIYYLYNHTDENGFYFSGFYYDSKEIGAESLPCFGTFDLKKKKWDIYHQEKTMATRNGASMIFYDMAVTIEEESSGKVCLLNSNSQKTISLKHKNESSSVYSGDDNCFYTCNKIYADDIKKPPTIRIQKYSLPNGNYLGSCKSETVPYYLIDLSEQEGFLSFYFDSNGILSYELLKI